MAKLGKLMVLIASIGAALAITPLFATDLITVYKQAVTSDPKYKAARAKWLVDRENLAINKAALLPQLGGKFSLARGRNMLEAIGSDTNYYSNQVGYSLNFSQPIFDFGSWAKVWGAEAVAKMAAATFLAAEEDLLQRVAQAYFEVLLAKDILNYSKSNKEAGKQLFIQAKHKFDVGLIAIADLEDTKANYDKTVADEIAAANSLNDKFETLSEITGKRYQELDSMRDDLPLLFPKPDNIEAWVGATERQNFDLLAARYDAIAARENIKAQAAGHLPTLNAQGGYNYTYSTNPNNNGFNRGKGLSAGLDLAVPIFQGGGVAAATRQADYQYQVKLHEQEKIYRSVISSIRQTYLGVLSNISKIKADRQAIRSAESSLRSTKASYTVGTRTMADVLTAQTQLYNAQKSFAQDQYNYIIQLLALKKLTGSLAVDDFSQINSWLKTSQTVVTHGNKEHKIKKPDPVKKSVAKNPRSIAKTNRELTVTSNSNAKIKVLAEEEPQEVIAGN